MDRDYTTYPAHALAKQACANKACAIMCTCTGAHSTRKMATEAHSITSQSSQFNISTSTSSSSSAQIAIQRPVIEEPSVHSVQTVHPQQGIARKAAAARSKTCKADLRSVIHARAREHSHDLAQLHNLGRMSCGRAPALIYEKPTYPASFRKFAH